DGVESQVFDLPDHWPLVPILDPPLDPALVAKPVLIEHLVDPSRRRAATGQPGCLTTAAAAVFVERSGNDPRRVDPTPEVPRHFTHEPLVPGRKRAQQLGLATVPFVEGHPVEVQAIASGAVVEFQADLPLGPVHHVVGDAGLTAAGAIVGP